MKIWHKAAGFAAAAALVAGLAAFTACGGSDSDEPVGEVTDDEWVEMLSFDAETESYTLVESFEEVYTENGESHSSDSHYTYKVDHENGVVEYDSEYAILYEGTWYSYMPSSESVHPSSSLYSEAISIAGALSAYATMKSAFTYDEDTQCYVYSYVSTMTMTIQFLGNGFRVSSTYTVESGGETGSSTMTIAVTDIGSTSVAVPDGAYAAIEAYLANEE